MKYQGPGVGSRPESVEGTGGMEDKTDEIMSLGGRDLRCLCLMPSNFCEEHY